MPLFALPLLKSLFFFVYVLVVFFCLKNENNKDWEIWTAAIMTDTVARDLFIGSVKKWASDGLSSQPLGDWYETTNGNPEGFRARPVVGGHLGTFAKPLVISTQGSIIHVLYFFFLALLVLWVIHIRG